MEEIIFCPNCMTTISTVDEKCPVCGYDVTTQNALHQLPVNTILNGRYIIGKVLGADDLVITYIGYDLKLDSKVAIKEYYPSGAANRSTSLTVIPTTEVKGNPFESGKSRFLKEANTPPEFVGDGNSVTIRDCFEENGTAYIVRGLLEGEDLSHYAKNHDAFEHDKELRDGWSFPKKDEPKRNTNPKKSLLIIAAAALVALAIFFLVPSNSTPVNKMAEETGAGPNATADIEASVETVSTPDPNIEKLASVREAIAEHRETTISQGDNHFVVILADGTVYAAGDNDNGQCNVSGWTDIIAVSAGDDYTVGLKADGTVVATEYIKEVEDERLEEHGDGHQYDVADWSDIVAISAGRELTLGLKADGTVVAAGFDLYGGNVEDWADIVAISAGSEHTAGLKSDGTVVAAGVNNYGQCNVQGWTDIVAVSSGSKHTVGLKADGTVVAVGDNDDGQCDVSDWTDIVAVSAGSNSTVGLRADGTVVEAGAWIYSISDWCNIVSVSSRGWGQNLGLKADGTAVTSAVYFERALSGLTIKLPVAG